MRITKYVLGLDGANRFDSFYILISPDAEAAVSAIIAKYPQVQMVNLCDSYANYAGKLNPQVEYIRLSLLSPFVHGKYRMGKPYGSWPLVCIGLYLISRSGAELLLKQFEGRGRVLWLMILGCTSSGAWMCVLCSLVCAAGRVVASFWHLVSVIWIR